LKKYLSLRLLSLIVIAYMLIAFSWWSVLLYTKNKDAFIAKAEHMKIVMAAEGSIKNNTDFIQTPVYKDLAKKYKRQEWMILGEAIVFVISLVIGVWLINRGYNKEIVVANQQRNFLLSITHELKSVSLKAEEQQVTIDIADQGLGINDKEKKKVFEKFYRIGSEDTRKTKGTGLGLFIVNEIIKAHQGSIIILDNEPRGSRFRIELPADSPFHEEVQEMIDI